MSISKLTTPTFVFRFPETISAYDAIDITFSSKKRKLLQKTKADLTLIENTDYSIKLTEVETQLFPDGVCLVQTRVKIGNTVSASAIYEYRMVDALSDTPFIPAPTPVGGN